MPCIELGLSESIRNTIDIVVRTHITSTSGWARHCRNGTRTRVPYNSALVTVVAVNLTGVMNEFMDYNENYCQLGIHIF